MSREVVKRLSFTAPAQYEEHNDGCDCARHNRRFTFIHIGSKRPNPTEPMWLPRRVDVQQYADGRNSRCMTIVLDGAKIEVVRSVIPQYPEPTRTWFGAWYGDPRHVNRGVRLHPANDHRRRASDGGDVTIRWYLPAPWPAGSELVIWREAWWWSLIDGQDPLAFDVADPQ